MSRSAAELRDLVRQAWRQRRESTEAMWDVLLRLSGTSPAALAAELRSTAGIGVIDDATGLQVDLTGWSEESARQLRCVMLRYDDGRLVLAAEDPWDDALLRRVSRQTKTQPGLAAISRALFESLVGTASGAGPARPSPARPAGDVADPVGQAEGPVVAFVDAAIHAALALGASDVHFECDRSGVTVKHRLDGVMVRHARMEGAEAAQEVISRIKVLAQLDITERRLPQDGRFRFGRQMQALDLRVSIMPSVFGEDAVLRILDKARLGSREDAITLDRLGFDGPHAQSIRHLAGRPSGMVLVTGPTGSGKTTTVYAVLSEINTGIEKIITIEDPVEYELPGVLQIPVSERKGLTFARGLRSILRHDPDRILVGEIRDAETAEIAVQSALTGHLVFTTVHANGLTDVMGRFRHFGLDMFGFMSALNGIVVQRLVRRLCPHCQGRRAPLERERGWLAAAGQSNVAEVPVAAGCDRCHGTGYGGRFVLAEVHQVDDMLRDLVTQGAPLSQIKRHAEQRETSGLPVQAAAQVAAQRTTLEEIQRVVGWT